jgi:hypothetical protein
MGESGEKRTGLIGRRLFPAAIGLLVCLVVMTQVRAHANPQAAPAQKVPPAVGTIKAISGTSLILTTDAGTELKVQLPPEVRVLRVPPGSKDLKEATSMSLSGLQPGDRILVRGQPGGEAGTFVASTVVAMKKEDIAEKQAREREEWQKHGIGGLVKGVDEANTTITISTVTATGSKDVLIHAPIGTVLRRYAPGSIKFDEAKVAPLAEIYEGDQLRARGARSADGNEFTADEVVSGTFRNVAGTILAVNADGGTLTVSDLATKKPVELRVTSESQLRKLPQPIAQRIALRLKGGPEPAGSNGNGSGGPAAQTGAPAAGGSAASANAGGGAGAAARNGGGDIQQMLTRLPVSSLNDFQKGDAVMIVATAGQGDGPLTVIRLLAGVEPILQGSSQGQAASILSPWSLSEGGGGDSGTP